MGLKEDILAFEDRAVKPVKAWGKDLFIKPMSAYDQDAWENERVKDQDKFRDNFRAKYLVKVLVDADGNRIFSDEEAIELGKKFAPTVNKLFNLAWEMNNLTEEDEKELLKN